ncbi:MAG: hypothetical protein HPY52_16860 [Firmicutes bacterium]|nr:hypothetical protein [Bacillota bacterium]
MKDLKALLKKCRAASDRPWRFEDGKIVANNGNVVLEAMFDSMTDLGPILDISNQDLDFILDASARYEEALKRTLAAEARGKELEYALLRLLNQFDSRSEWPKITVNTDGHWVAGAVDDECRDAIRYAEKVLEGGEQDG